MLFFFFFFNDTATTEIYTLSLHDALPICPTADYLMSSGGFAVGQTLGAVVSAARAMFSPSARRDMDADFQDFMRPLRRSPQDNGKSFN